MPGDGAAEDFSERIGLALGLEWTNQSAGARARRGGLLNRTSAERRVREP